MEPRKQKIFEDGSSNIISLSSGENLDDFYEQEPVVVEEVKTQIITGSQSLESTLSEESKKKFESAVKVLNDPISLSPPDTHTLNIIPIKTPESEGDLPKVPKSDSDEEEQFAASGEFNILE